MARIRPTEHKAIVALLDAPADSVEDLATDVLLKIDELREARPDWFIVKVDPGVAVTLHGPYITRNAAKKEIERGDLVAASDGATALILQRINSMYEGVESFTQGELL